jgi:hypothetical protein
LRFRGDPVANTPAAPTGIGRRCHEPAHPADGRLTALHSRSRPPRTYGLFQTRPHGSPPTPNPSTSRPPGQFRAAPLPPRCWVPPVRAPGQDFHLRSQQHAWHTRGGLAAGPDGLLLTPPAACAHWLVGRESPPRSSRTRSALQHPPVSGYEFATRARRNRPRIRALGSRLAAPGARICRSEACARRPPPRLPCRRSRVRVPSAALTKAPHTGAFAVLEPARRARAAIVGSAGYEMVKAPSARH